MLSCYHHTTNAALHLHNLGQPPLLLCHLAPRGPGQQQHDEAAQLQPRLALVRHQPLGRGQHGVRGGRQLAEVAADTRPVCTGLSCSRSPRRPQLRSPVSEATRSRTLASWVGRPTSRSALPRARFQPRDLAPQPPASSRAEEADLAWPSRGGGGGKGGRSLENMED